MKFYLLPFLFLFFCIQVVAQKRKDNIFFCGYVTSTKADELCSFFQSNAMLPNRKAENAVDKILEPLGLPRNFVLVSCPKIKNAVAITPADGIRYIVYDNEFMESIDRSTTNWASVSILAHEIGHHLSGHTLVGSTDLPDNRRKELEADEFSGFILFKMGATLEQAQAAIASESNENDDTYSTHPKRSKRLEAIEKGFNKAKAQQPIPEIDDNTSFESALALGKKAMDNQFYELASRKFTEAIGINPNNSLAYSSRGVCKALLKDFQGAINDYNKAIQIDPKDIASFTNRGSAKRDIGDEKGALSDYNMAIQINPEYAFGYYNLGMFYASKGIESIENQSKSYDYFSKSLENFNKSIEIDQNNHYAYFYRGMLKIDRWENHNAAIEDFTTAIIIEPNFAESFFKRGISKSKINDNNGALKDLDKAISLKPNNGNYYQERLLIKLYKLDDNEGAIKDCNKIIQLNKEDFYTYYHRGIAKANLEDFDGGIQDLYRSIELNSKFPLPYLMIGLILYDLGKPNEGCKSLQIAADLGYQEAINKIRELCK